MTVTSSEHCRIPVAQRAADLRGDSGVPDSYEEGAELVILRVVSVGYGRRLMDEYVSLRAGKVCSIAAGSGWRGVPGAMSFGNLSAGGQRCNAVILEHDALGGWAGRDVRAR
jgi:hypothetical protein